ncbi:TPA: nascent polypeptide-associated complex protein [Candidatus Micrarchaeota archaeon]|nr:nascent polypeptide-associated complex protein [Candidatus Micrarchaeota archaeon]
MLPNTDPKQMERMMKQMGINSRQIPASRVVIETDSENLIIENPQITEISMQGQKSYQIAGTIHSESRISEEDIKMVMEQAGVDKEKATESLKKSKGDIAAAIMDLKQ